MRRLLWGLAIGLLLAGCTLPPPQPGTTPQPTVTPTGGVPEHEPRFDGDRAMAHVRAQVEQADGTPLYRTPGTEGNEVVAQYIKDELEALGYEVAFHHFSARYGCEQLSMRNVIAEKTGASGGIVAFAAHFDTRPLADKDPDPTRRGEPVLGANDGASGVAVLLELARVLPGANDTVRMLFFDGEDGGGRWNGCSNDWILGSRAYAESLNESEIARIEALVLVDMVGDHDLLLPKEGYTAGDARGSVVQDAIYETAARLGHDEFLMRLGQPILDDHVPFLERMVPAVDLIHTIPDDPRVFPDWHHTTFDTIDQVSPESLAAVGRTVETWFVERARG